MDDNTKIAGKRTVGDWKKRRATLLGAPSAQDWENIFSDFLLERVKTRYLVPIEAIEEISAKEGKGFSIIAICCSLMEFFESLVGGYYFDGSDYRDERKSIVLSNSNFDKKTRLPYPLRSKEVFISFLTKNSPFSVIFPTVPDAVSFYENVRCSVLHQAETGGNWIIKDNTVTKEVIYGKSPSEIHLGWKPLKEALIDFLENVYKQRLIKESAIQKNFIFKFDSICQLI